MGVAAGGPIDIYIAPDQQSFLHMQPHIPPDWADGTAWPHQGLIFLRSSDIRRGTSSPLPQVLDHEIAHILLGRAFAHRGVPRWLQEGVAQLVAREYNSQTVERLASGVAGDSLLSLRQLSKGFPKDPLRASLAYAQSADFVAFLHQKHGKQSIQTLIREMSSGKPFAASLQLATGHNIDQLDLQWRGQLNSSWMWLGGLVSDSFLLGMTGLLLFWGVFRKRAQNQERMKKWEEDDAIQDALAAQVASWSQYKAQPIWLYDILAEEEH
jgi:hypothetical protein